MTPNAGIPYAPGMEHPPTTRERRLAREVRTALAVSRNLSRCRNVDDVILETLRSARDVVGAQAASILLADPESGGLVFHHVVGDKADALKGVKMSDHGGIAGEVFRTGQVQVTRDASEDPLHSDWVDGLTGFRTRDMVTIPLKRWDGACIGVLQVLNKRRGRLGQSDVGILTILATLATAALTHARQAEQDRLAEVGRLLGDISHDVANMLTPVLCGCELLQLRLADPAFRLPGPSDLPEDPGRMFRDILDLLQVSVHRLQDRVREIADCVKGLSSPLNLAPCPLGRVVDDVFRTLKVPADRGTVSLITEGLESLPALIADERRLFVALYNLVNNAIPEVPPGGSVRVRGMAEPGSVVLDVIDTGRGMPAEVRDSLFTDRTISRKSGGTGLGTRIARDVVVAHGGTISVDSREGAGTTFHLRLPTRPPGYQAAGGKARHPAN